MRFFFNEKQLWEAVMRNGVKWIHLLIYFYIVYIKYWYYSQPFKSHPRWLTSYIIKHKNTECSQFNLTIYGQACTFLHQNCSLVEFNPSLFSSKEEGYVWKNLVISRACCCLNTSVTLPFILLLSFHNLLQGRIISFHSVVAEEVRKWSVTSSRDIVLSGRK